MDYTFAPDNAILAQIGEKIHQRRISIQLTQKQLAENAGVALSAVGSIEKGKNCSLLTLVQILRALKSMDLLEPFFREEEISPVRYAELMRQNNAKKRVRVKKNINSSNSSEIW